MPHITLQISLAPSDYRHSKFLLLHQIRVFENQVDEILLTYDTHRSNGRFSINWKENNEQMWDFLQELYASNAKIRLIKIDYSEKKVKEVANFFFSRNNIPAKDWRGGPFYTYFFGMYEAKFPDIFHIDSDLFFGGLSKTWLDEATSLYKKDPKILFINPLPGPPTANGKLYNQNSVSYNGLNNHHAFDTVSTRLYLVNKFRLADKKLKNIKTLKLGELIRAIIRKNPAYKLPEEFLSAHMQKHNFIRVDFEGQHNGLWSLHPPYRTPKFYDELPMLIQRIEKNDIPEAQRGHYDIVDQLFDWSEAREKLKN